MATTRSVGRRLGRSWRLLALVGLVIAAMVVAQEARSQQTPTIIVEHGGEAVSETNPLVLAHDSSTQLTIRASAAPSNGKSLRINIWDLGGKVRFDWSGGAHNKIIDLEGNDWKQAVTVYAATSGKGNLSLFATNTEFAQRSLPFEVLKPGVAVTQQQIEPPPTPVVTIEADAASVTEGTSITYTLTATPPPSAALTDISVQVTEYGDVSGDLRITSKRTLTIPDSGSVSFSVSTLDDSVDEPDGVVSARMHATKSEAYDVASTAPVSVTVEDDDADPSLDEALEALKTRIETQIANSDGKVSRTENDVWRRAWATLLGVAAPHGWNRYTASEARGYARANLRVNNQEAASIWEAIAEHIDPPKITITGGGVVYEGEAAEYTLVASRAPKSDLSINLTVSQSGDFAASGQTGSRSVPIASGTTSAQLDVSTIDDGVQEAEGSITVRVDSGNGYAIGSARSATTKLIDDDSQLPVVTISAPESVIEGQPVVYTLVATPAPKSAIQVPVEVTQERDYTTETGSHTVSISSSGTGTLSIATIDDSIDELWGGVTATMQTGAGYELGNKVSVRVGVSDNDVSTVTISSTQSSVTEGQRVSFTLTSSLQRSYPLTVRLQVDQAGQFIDAGDIGENFVNIPKGGTYVYHVDTLNDAVDELDGSLTVTLKVFSDNFVVSDPASITVAVTDNDSPPSTNPAVSISSASSSVEEGDTIVYTVTADSAPTEDINVRVDLSQSGDFALVGTVYVAIPAGSTEATLTVQTSDDAAKESDGSLTAAIGAGAGYGFGSLASVTVAVTDNDAPTDADQQAQEALETAIQNRIDLTANRGDTHSNQIWRRALAAVRGNPPPSGLTRMTQSIAQSLADGHRNGGRTVLADLWQDIADALSS